jgi:hypothetical protein
MFRYPVVTKIADILVRFLETVERTDTTVFNVVDAHVVAMLYVLKSKTSDGEGERENKLLNELLDACNRYYKARDV